MRVALLVESAMCHSSHFMNAFVSAMRQEFSGCELFATHDDHALVLRRVAERQSQFDVVVIFVWFRKLGETAEALNSIQLPVVVVEHDAYQNYIRSSLRRGEWSRFLSRNRVDLIVVSGRRHYERLRAEGHESLYLPKAAPAEFLSGPNDNTGMFCAFGSVSDPVYARRAALFAALERAGVEGPRSAVVHRLRFDFTDMATTLARYSGCVICDLGLEEPMIRHFEVAALGLAPIRDDEAEDELNALGYKDGKSMIVYRSRDDLIDKLGHYRRHGSELQRIQEAARAATRHHTWEERARTLRQALIEYFGLERS